MKFALLFIEASTSLLILANICMLLKYTLLGITNLQSLQALYPTPAPSKKKSKLPDILISCMRGVKHPAAAQVQAGSEGRERGGEHHQGEQGRWHGLTAIDEFKWLMKTCMTV